MIKGNTIWFLIVIGALLGFLIARLAFKTNVTDTYIDNPSMIKQIAELSTLQVDGEAKLTESNIGSDKTIWQDIKNYFQERTLLLNIPYAVKYGCKLGDSDIMVKSDSKNELTITMSEPKVLSFEFRMDKLQQFSKNGAFVFQKDDRLKAPLQNLYNQTKTKMETNAENLKKAKENIQKILSSFFKPAGIKVSINFKNQ